MCSDAHSITLNKARNIFRTLNNVWKSSQYSKPTKIKLPELRTIYFAMDQMLKTTQSNCQLFHTKSLRRILRIFWPNKISNEDLLRQCNQESMATILIRRRWKWIGHVIRRDQTSITKTALHWTPEGKRKRGKPKNIWRHRRRTQVNE